MKKSSESFTSLAEHSPTLECAPRPQAYGPLLRETETGRPRSAAQPHYHPSYFLLRTHADTNLPPAPFENTNGLKLFRSAFVLLRKLLKQFQGS